MSCDTFFLPTQPKKVINKPKLSCPTTHMLRNSPPTFLVSTFPLSPKSFENPIPLEQRCYHDVKLQRKNGNSIGKKFRLFTWCRKRPSKMSCLIWRNNITSTPRANPRTFVKMLVADSRTEKPNMNGISKKYGSSAEIWPIPIGDLFITGLKNASAITRKVRYMLTASNFRTKGYRGVHGRTPGRFFQFQGKATPPVTFKIPRIIVSTILMSHKLQAPKLQKEFRFSLRLKKSLSHSIWKIFLGSNFRHFWGPKVNFSPHRSLNSDLEC